MVLGLSMTISRGVDDNSEIGRLSDSRLYRGVLSRRVLAFLFDYFLVGLMMIPAGAIILLLGIVTLGLGWMLFAILFPAIALIYIWSTLGSAKQATLGMRMMSIRLERLDGGRVDGLLAIIHSVLFWALSSLLTPLILLATLFLDYKRTLHDLLLGTLVVRTDR